MTRLICLLSFCVFGSAAIGGPFQYECTIKHMMTDDGSDRSFILENYKQEKIYIERETGIVLFRYWAKSAADIVQSIVLATGNSSSYYKSVMYTRNDVMVAVSVKEFERGRQKPMTILENGYVFTGVCV